MNEMDDMMLHASSSHDMEKRKKRLHADERKARLVKGRVGKKGRKGNGEQRAARQAGKHGGLDTDKWISGTNRNRQPWRERRARKGQCSATSYTTDLRVVAVGELDDEGVRVGHPGGLLHLRLRRALAVSPQQQVLLDARREQRRLLAHQPNLLPEPPELQRLEVMPVQKDLPCQNQQILHNFISFFLFCLFG